MSGANSINLARLFVQIMPSMEGMEGNIGAAMGAPIEREAKKAGEKSGNGFGGTFGDFAKKAILAAGIGAAVMKSFDGALENQKSTNKMTAAMGLSPEEAAEYGSIAGNLYANAYGDSMADVSGAIDSVASTLVKTGKVGKDQIEGLTGQAMSLASAFDVDVAEAANTAGVLMESGLAGGAQEAFDLITGAGQAVPAQMRGEIFPIMDEYSKHFAGLGIDGQQAFGMMTMAARDGAIGMDKVGDSLKEFQIRSTDMSKSTSGAYETLGLDMTEMTNAILGGGAGANDALGKIINGLTEIDDPAAQASAALALFGTPLEDLGVDKIPAFLGTLDPMGDVFDSTAGAAGKLDEAMGAGAANALPKFTRSIETLGTGLATSMLPALTSVADMIIPLVKGLEPFAPLILAGAAAWGVISAAMWVASLTPITLTIAGIVLGLTLLVAGIMIVAKNWDSIWNGMQIIAGGFFNWIGEILGGFGNWWNQVWGGFGNYVKEIWDGMLAGIKTVWDGFIAWITPGWTVWAKITDTAWRLISDTATLLWGGMMNWIKEIWDGFIVWITPALTFFQGIWNAVWGAVSGFVTTTWNNIVMGVQIAWAAFIAWITPGLDAFLGIWNTIWGAVSGFVSETWTKISGAVKEGIDQVTGFFGEMGGAIGGKIGEIAGEAFTWGKNIVEGLLNGLRGMEKDIQSFFATLIPGWIIDPFKEALDINSPSRVFYELGEFTGDGYIGGAESKKQLIKKSMESLVTVPQPTAGSLPAYAVAAAGPAGGDTYNIDAGELDTINLAELLGRQNERRGRR